MQLFVSASILQSIICLKNGRQASKACLYRLTETSTLALSSSIKIAPTYAQQLVFQLIIAPTKQEITRIK